MIAGAWDLLAWAGYIVGFGVLFVLLWRDTGRAWPAHNPPPARPARHHHHLRVIPAVYDQDRA